MIVHDETRILGTTWRAQIRSIRSATRFDYSGGVDIILSDQRTGKVVELAKGSQVEQAALESSVGGQIDITLPNRTNIEFFDVSIYAIKIVYHFTPNDDLDDRLSYYRWFHDKGDESNRLWYCENVMSSLGKSGQILENRTYGMVALGRERYCPDLL